MYCASEFMPRIKLTFITKHQKLCQKYVKHKTNLVVWVSWHYQCWYPVKNISILEQDSRIYLCNIFCRILTLCGKRHHVHQAAQIK